MSKAYKGAILTAVITTIVCIGDTILYSVLPVYADDLGFSDFWLGIILSINRFVRLATHGIIASFILKFGLRKIVLGSSIGASISVFLYTIPSFVFLFTLARIIWGIAYSGLRQVNLFYAAKDDEKRNRSFVLSNVVKSIGPFSILLLGPFVFNELGYVNGFVSIAFISLLGIVFAFFLPNIDVEKEEYNFRKVLNISYFKIILLLVSFIANGFIVVVLYILFYSPALQTESLLITVSFYLLIKRLISFLLPILFLKSYSIISVSFHFYFGIILVVLGLLFLSQGFYRIGIVSLFLGSTFIENAAPLEGLKKSQLQKMELVTSVTLWWDIGKAIGALLGIIIYKNVGGDDTFLLFSLLLVFFTVKKYFNDNIKKVEKSIC